MTDLDTYQPAGQLGQYQPRMAMTPADAQALDDQLTQCIKAILHEGTDYGLIPGTNEKSLWRPGAQKLLLWFALSFTCDRIYDIDTDDDGHRLGVTYRATIYRRFPDGSKDVAATCEGYAGYDESKFFKSAEEVRRDAEAKERYWAKKDRRVADPTKWQGLPEWRAPWNSVIKRAQKRAIVGGTLDATSAGGRFNQEREEDDHTPPPADDGPSWYEQAIEAALNSTETEPGGELQTLFTGAAQAHRDGLISRRQQDHVQNTVRQRLALLKKATAVVEAEDLARAAQDSPRTARGTAAGDGARTRTRNADAPASAQDGTGDSGQPLPPPPGEDEPASDEGAKEEVPAEDQPGSVGDGQLQMLHTLFTGLGFGGDDREQKLVIAEVITRHNPLTGPSTRGRSSKNLSLTEARALIDTLDGFADRDALIAHMAEHEDYVRQETSDA